MLSAVCLAVVCVCCLLLCEQPAGDIVCRWSVTSAVVFVCRCGSAPLDHISLNRLSNMRKRYRYRTSSLITVIIPFLLTFTLLSFRPPLTSSNINLSMGGGVFVSVFEILLRTRSVGFNSEQISFHFLFVPLMVIHNCRGRKKKTKTHNTKTKTKHSTT